MKEHTVYLSPLAVLKLDLLLNYLEKNWGGKTKNLFIKKLKNTMSQLSKFPKSFPESKYMKGIYRCVITRQVSIYYRIHIESVEIITVIDNRQDPDSVAEEIKKHFSLL